MNENKVRAAYALFDRNGYAKCHATDVFKLLTEALAPEPRFYVGQPVLVSENEKVWFPRALVSITGSGFECKPTGHSKENVHWLHCKPDPDAVSLPNWIEHDGSEKRIDGDFILWEGKAGNKGSLRGYVILDSKVARYCIIPLPRWVGEKVR